jgi:SulP family sulfate permease
MALIAPLALPESPQYVVFVLTLSFLVGVIQLTLGFSGIGKWVEKVPHSVIVGFTAGAAVLIINSQAGTLLGMKIPRGTDVMDTLKVIANFALSGDIQWQSIVLVLITLAIIRLWNPLNKYVPSMLIAVIIGAIVAILIELAFSAMSPFKRVSSIPGAFPPISMPDLSLPTLQKLLAATLIMTLLASTEAMAIARAIALKSKDQFNANQEFIGQGLANIAGSFFSAYPSSGSFNRTGVNLAAGAKTPLSAISAAIFLIIILAFVSPLAKHIPYVVIASLLLTVAWKLIDLKQIRHEFNMGKKEWIPMVITAIGTVAIPLEWAILLGIFSAMVMQRMFRKK